MTVVNLTAHLLERGRHLRRLGRTADAVRTLNRLAGFRELPPPTAEETQALLGEMHLGERNYRRARRHLTAALCHRPGHALRHRHMAAACHADGSGDARRALHHYRRAIALDGDDLTSLCDGGLLAVRVGRTDEGLSWLRHALELAPDDAAVVGKAARGLGQAGQADEARVVLRAALFRNPRDPRFRKLYTDFQFRELRRRQELERLQSETAAPDEGPTLLPFLRPVGESAGSAAYDGPATLPGPYRSTERPAVEGRTGSGDSQA